MKTTPRVILIGITTLAVMVTVGCTVEVGDAITPTSVASTTAEANSPTNAITNPDSDNLPFVTAPRTGEPTDLTPSC